MEVTNNCSFEVAAVVKSVRRGRGDIVNIQPGSTEEVFGPRVHHFSDDRASEKGAGCIHMNGKAVVHEGDDDKTGWKVVAGAPLSLGGGSLTLIVCHPSDVKDE